MIRHCVLCRFREDVDDTVIDGLRDRLIALCDALPNVLDVDLGANASPEGLGQGFGHGFVVDFVDAAARDAYLEDETHRAFGADLVALLEGGTDGLVVFDLAM